MDAFDAAYERMYKEFRRKADELNSISPKSKVNFLHMFDVRYTNLEDHIKIIKYLIKKNIDIDYTGEKDDKE